MAILILVVDDHHVVRCGIRDFLEHHADLDLVGEAGQPKKSLALIDELQPDVVLMDIQLPGEMNGIEATAEITKRYSDVKVIAIAGLHQNVQFRRVMKAGACGYLLKAIASNEIAEAIRKAHAGEELLPTEIMGPLLDDSQIELTDREHEVLGLIARGLTNRQIANTLDMSIHTALFHVRNIRTELGAKNNAEVTSIAVRQRLLDLHWKWISNAAGLCSKLSAILFVASLDFHTQTVGKRGNIGNGYCSFGETGGQHHSDFDITALPGFLHHGNDRLARQTDHDQVERFLISVMEV